jgi:hypothetical protein
LLTQFEGKPGPHRIYRTSYKAFTMGGLVRETEVVEDSTSALVTTLKEGADFGPDEALQTFSVLFWGQRLNPFPDVDVVPIGTIGPKVPPGLTGDQYIRTFGRIPSFITWNPARVRYPNAAWPDGVFFKVMDEDAEMGSVMQLLRLQPGTSMPRWANTGATHFLVLQGAVDLNVPGQDIVHVGPMQYAFLPPGLAVEVANPRVR